MTSIDDALNDLDELLDMEDESLYNNIIDNLKDLTKRIENMKTSALLNKKYDSNDCIFEINSGAGGTEAADWASMLLRMYERYLSKHKFKYQVLSLQEGDEAGIKSVSLSIKGDHPYGYLKSEAGVHRLVRISPFDSNKRRHTSFASVSVYPVIESKDIDINEADLKIDVYRSSGKGGQGVNTTDSAVRITHLPTGIVVTCQNERSQIQNKETAIKVLYNKLQLMEEAKHNAELSNFKNINKIEFGNQIRNYVMQPYTLVKDVRTGYEETDVNKVLDGFIDNFIKEYLIKEGANDN